MPPGGPSWTRIEKPESLWGTLAALLRYMGGYRWHIIAGILLSLVSSAALLIAPQYLATMTDGISDGIYSGTADLALIGGAGAVLALLYVVSMVFSTLQNYVVPRASELNGDAMRRDLSRKTFRIPLRTLDRMSTGDVMSLFTNDTDTVRTQSAECICDTVTALTMMAGSVVMMLLTESTLALASIVPVAAGFAVMLAVIKGSQGYFVAQARSLGQMNALVEELYYGMDIVNTYNDGERAMSRFTEINDSLYRSAFRTRFATSLMPRIMDFVSNIGYVTVCVFGSMLILEGRIDFGILVAFIVYVRQFVNPMLRLSDNLASMQSVAASAERVFEFMGKEELEDESGKAPREGRAEGRVTFEDVRFSYVEGTPVIHGLDMDVLPGQKIAIVGPTGAGKSTIANILLRFYEIDSGRISIDGEDISMMRREDLRDLFCVVPQEAWTFGGTIRDNLAMGRDVDDAKMRAVCDSVGAGRFIDGMEDGYNTVLDESVQLSVGQRQLLMIARAMVRDSPILILDEATSSVDTALERKVNAAMDSLMEGRTSFVIAHRLSTIKDADCILVVRDGRIAEKGTFSELLSAGGFFKSLYDSQFEGCDRRR
jgi:ATP-binding cassette subfamily B protein